jgi:hypothetical protein
MQSMGSSLMSGPAARSAGSRCLAALVVVFALVLYSPAVRAQPAQPGELPSIDAATRAAIVDSVTAVIDSVYVLEEPAKHIVAGLKENLAKGDYDDLTDPAAFAERLYRDAQAIHHDGHFRIAAIPPLDTATVKAGQDRDPAEVERFRRIDRARNYGFRKAEILPGGIGYLCFDRFADGDEAFAAAAAAMNFVANSNAVILDLRNNGGGSAAMIRFICGYLFEEDKHLINWDIRVEKKTVQSYSADYVPGQRIAKQPVYVLTSRRTFSAAEEFTFDLKNLKRAVIVGDTTGGGGHTVASYTFAFTGFRVVTRIPFGRAYNPETNQGWEGVGVIPDMAVPADQALDAARADALKKLIDGEKDETIAAMYRWDLTDLQSRLKPVTLSSKQMRHYVGRYGPRRISLEGGALYYQREDQPRYKMEPMGEDLFRVSGLDFFRLRFERDASGKIVKLVGMYDDGKTDENPRD